MSHVARRGARLRGGLGAVIALVGVVAAACALWGAGHASAATVSCADVKDHSRSEVVFAIRASGTTCAVARRLAARTGPFAHSRSAPWKFTYAGFVCRGGWSWDQTRPRGGRASSAGHRETSEGVSYARWRCTKGKAFARFVRAINYGG